LPARESERFLAAISATKESWSTLSGETRG
jgi:hypothetical protein